MKVLLVIPAFVAVLGIVLMATVTPLELGRVGGNGKLICKYAAFCRKNERERTDLLSETRKQTKGEQLADAGICNSAAQRYEQRAALTSRDNMVSNWGGD